MNVFELRNRLINDYGSYTRSFIKILDERIKRKVDEGLEAGAFWPEPLLQLNPTFRSGGTIDELVEAKLLHPECSRIFRIGKSGKDHSGATLLLHAHQKEAIQKAHQGKSYVLTSGTGSGKSLTYIVPIVDHVLKAGSGKGIQAIVVYPMNALANSQEEELQKFLSQGYPEGKSPVSFRRYTGQEPTEVKEQIRRNPPDILLTNYMMLELLLTRHEDRQLVQAARGLNFLVFDELHTYRGRQGADVALLIRRCRMAFDADHAICIGTSATMTSDGNTTEQKQNVAEVAQKLFGIPFTAEQIIGETLERATPELDFHAPQIRQALRDVIVSKADPPDGYEEFRLHPLSSWIESTFGIQPEEATGVLVRQTPRPLRGAGSASEELAALTETDAEDVQGILMRFLLRGSELRRDAASRFPIFAFRLHQFLTRGDTVWATMEPGEERYLDLSKKITKPGEPEKPLFPLVFCRHCGEAYYRVKEEDTEEGMLLLPRDDHRGEDDDGHGDGYLFVSEENPWPDLKEDCLERLPSHFKETTTKGDERVKKGNRGDVPGTVFVDAGGRLVPNGKGMRAALIRGDFLFCLNPNCQVAYSKRQKSERSKLATLGVDNRSTATTILAVKALIELQKDRELEKEARKLLSFTDNRQDASLQAGHFNDFTLVSLIRSALYKALESMGQGLKHGNLTRNVFEALRLDFYDYAADPNVKGPARTSTEDAFRRVLEYYLYRDLQRGWRVTAPNLEECGLLHFDYMGLKGPDSLLEDSAVWETGITIQTGRNEKKEIPVPPVLARCKPEKREELLLTLLDYLRRSLAIKADVLDNTKQQDLINQTQPRLRDDTVWYLRDPKELSKAVVAYPRSSGEKDEYYSIFLSSRSNYGMYAKQVLSETLENGKRLGQEETEAAIRFLFQALALYGILGEVRSGEVPGYQINPDALLWRVGSGELRPCDRTQIHKEGEISLEANQYFANCYRSFVDLECMLEAREHTAQVSTEDRQEREDRFRRAELPLLFCSPTMELGVDIAQLNLVNMRNAPPTPANYAQRSGRAGRGGQPALVYTYCAGRSPHDQYYFHAPERMVAGSVTPPRIDLCNRDLLKSHLHAIWMEVSGLSLDKTLASVLDLSAVDKTFSLPVQETIRKELSNPVHRTAALVRANRLIAGMRSMLAETSWFHDNWAKETLDQLERSFDAACDRWRSLYRSARRQQELHNRIVTDHSRSPRDRDRSVQFRAQAESQIRLLTQTEGLYEGDFYTYRYLASEGFLPGYNFPRLPISAYVPGRARRKGRDEFVSRPRFLAISEFGPSALIYHEGARYRVNKVNLDFGTDDIDGIHHLNTSTMKRCRNCGYAHLMDGSAPVEICDQCGTALEMDSRIQNLVQLQNVSLRLAQRITCDEESRQQLGYRLETAYRFSKINESYERKDAEVFIGDTRVMKLSYGDTAELFRINLGWARGGKQSAPGFELDLERGYWGKGKNSEEQDDDEENPLSPGQIKRVVPYVRDTKNALVMSFEPARSRKEMASLQAAFKEAIQKYFQIESRELACEPMPSNRDRKEILFYESSEGGAGVLRQLVEDPFVIRELAQCALEICHFDPVTLEDRGAETCGKACYECLLDYTNQSDHGELDRNLICGFLSDLRQAISRNSGGVGSRAGRLEKMFPQCDSLLEKKWLNMLESLELRLPSHAQFLVESCSTRPDFFYQEYSAAIYVDGPPHDEAGQIRKDEEITRNLQEDGYIVIRFHHRDDWEQIFRRHPDIFGRTRS